MANFHDRHIEQMMLAKWQAARRGSRRASVLFTDDHSLQGKHEKTHAVC